MIFDEADRMLDMGFEREMNQCLDIIKHKSKKFIMDGAITEDMKQAEKDKILKTQTFHSDTLKVNFVSATMNPKVETLGKRLMKDYIKVGFENDKHTEYDAKNEIEDMVGSIPKQVQ